MKSTIHSFTTGAIGVATFALALLAYGPFQEQLKQLMPAPYATYLPTIFLVAGFTLSWLGKGPFSSPAPGATISPTPPAAAEVAPKNPTIAASSPQER